MQVLKCELVKNREDRPRYVSLVTYEQRWVLVGEDEQGPIEALKLVPVRRTYQWVVGDTTEGDPTEMFQCTRVTELRWKDLRAQPAHREFMEQWLKHVKSQLAKLKKGGRTVKVEVVS